MNDQQQIFFDSAGKTLDLRARDSTANHQLDSMTYAATHADPRAQSLATGIQGIVGLILLIAWVAIAFYFIRFLLKRKKTGRGQLPLQTAYGAWQDHNMGTTDLEPGELTRIEKELRVEPKREE